jgi:hypothetical protein
MKYVVVNDAGEIIGRFDSSFHAVIPKGAIRITETLWNSTLNDTDGVWRLVDGELVKQPLPEALVFPDADARAWRDAEIARIAWLRDRHRDELEMSAETTITTEQYVELLAYIKALRDWPQSSTFPAEEERPVAPQWLSIAQENAQ